jgi:hypothetical protein
MTQWARSASENVPRFFHAGAIHACPRQSPNPCPPRQTITVPHPVRTIFAVVPKAYAGWLPTLVVTPAADLKVSILNKSLSLLVSAPGLEPGTL